MDSGQQCPSSRSDPNRVWQECRRSAPALSSLEGVEAALLREAELLRVILPPALSTPAGVRLGADRVCFAGDCRAGASPHCVVPGARG